MQISVLFVFLFCALTQSFLHASLIIYSSHSSELAFFNTALQPHTVKMKMFISFITQTYTSLNQDIEGMWICALK